MSDGDKTTLRTRLLSQLRDEVEAKDNDILEFAVKIRDEDVLRRLIDKKHAWEEHRSEFGMEHVPYVMTEEYRRVVEKYTTLSVTDSADSEKWALLRYFTSKAEHPEVKNLKLIKWLIEFVDNDVGENVTQLQFMGEQGAGKTDFAFLLAELWKFQSNNRAILTDVKNVDGTVHVGSRDELREWTEKNEGKEFIFVFDEANKDATGTDHQKVKKQLFGLITFLRKKKGNIIIIGHTGTDIHPWLRELMDVVYKRSNKVAEIYKEINSNTGEPEGLIRTIRGIPRSSLKPPSMAETEWEWSEEQIQQCVGTNSDGDRCGAVTRADWDEQPDLFCDAHQNQDEPHPDVTDEELLNTRFEERVVDDEEEDEKEGGNETVDGTTGGGKADESETVEDVPERFWSLLQEKTNGAYTRKNVDSLDTFEEVLSDSEWRDLQERL